MLVKTTRVESMEPVKQPELKLISACATKVIFPTILNVWIRVLKNLVSD